MVTCPIEIRTQRLINRGVDKNVINNIILSQWSDKEKVKKSKLLIENDEHNEKKVCWLDGLFKFGI